MLGGDYIIPIKENQKNFYNDLKLYFDQEKCDEIIAGNSKSVYYTENEKSHSSYIKYEYFQTSDIDWYSNINDWEGIHSIGLVRKTITKKLKLKMKEKMLKRIQLKR